MIAREKRSEVPVSGWRVDDATAPGRLSVERRPRERDTGREIGVVVNWAYGDLSEINLSEREAYELAVRLLDRTEANVELDYEPPDSRRTE